ncbi:TetR/AcrR family transcriptional regulator [Actinomadura sp. WMMB 499]|uniref:TetR/AcrR family transcriptional regulator n=1 Tax=Actinomadura sp. WMMB 499 TaxID=1219491 RepID=UPI0012492903|nr:TetR/AcrR family transcriptional regulator [Actinomadura sp. WMMB 499]QFG23050.1 helix-turn-helix transcriptional regulator [Actinomadura sp. WMMB 499]
MDGGARSRRREQTRRTLLREGRRLFAERGYGAVGLAEIVAAAGVTKGALYHHFDGKGDLFRAVLAEVQGEVAARVAATADAEDDAWAQLLAGCRAFLTASTAPDVQRVMLVDGPAVLGWSEWRAMDEAASARHLTDALTGLVERGTIAPRPVEPLARLLSGAMNEAALWLAGSARPDRDLDDAWAALARMLEAFRAE